MTNNVVHSPEHKFFTPAYKCSLCMRYFDGYVCGQLIEGDYRFRGAKPIANLCETCLFILRFWAGEIATAQAAASDSGAI